MMAKTTKTVTVQEAVCDRCGAVGDTGNDEGRTEWGEMTVAYRGHTGGRTWQGDAAGRNHDGKLWLCMACTTAFLAFIKPVKEGGAA